MNAFRNDLTQNGGENLSSWMGPESWGNPIEPTSFSWLRFTQPIC